MNSPKNRDALKRLRAFVYTLPAEERSQLLAFLRLAEQLITPLPSIEYGRFPDLQERRRRALTPRPGDYPGRAAA